MTDKFSLSEELLEEHGCGYVPDTRFNTRFKEQGLDCGFEHCIETMPYHEAEEKLAIKLDYYLKYTAQGFVRCDSTDPEAIPDINRIILERGYQPGTCRKYRHSCPGGHMQVYQCDLEGKFPTTIARN